MSITQIQPLIIERNIPIPAKGGKVLQAVAFLKKLKPGESIAPKGWPYLGDCAALVNAMSRLNKSRRKYISRTYKNGDDLSLRIWRVK